MKSIRSIQNQSLKNIEIIIVDDCSTDNSSNIFKYLLETEPRIRIFTHLKNLGVWRSRIDGFLYSRGKYVIHFDVGDLYEDNYVLEDAYNIAKKYNLDSIKMFFRLIYSYKNFKNYKIPYKFKKKYVYTKIVYKPNIENYNKKFYKGWGNIWNRLTRKNIFAKGLYLLNNDVLNIYKNFWEDVWWNKLVNKVSYSFLVIKRFQYLYYKGDKKGEGSIKIDTEIQRDNMIHEFIYFLYFDLNFLGKKDSKAKIINSLRRYNNIKMKINLSHFKTKFYILDNLLNNLIKDPFVSKKDKNFLHKLLIDSIKRQNRKKK
jgi:glycosyltransferase involved in cell wall biosynthesis